MGFSQSKSKRPNDHSITDVPAETTNYRDSRLSQASQPVIETVLESHYEDAPLLAELERQAQADGLKFARELVFENGAVYTGYTRGDNSREGPGEQVWQDGARY